MSKRFMKKLAVGGSALVAAVGAHAEGAQTVVTGAITAAGADVAVYGAALVGLTVIGVGFAVGMKYLKKIKPAA